MNQWLEKHRNLILTLIGLSIAAGVFMFAVRWEPAAKIIIAPPLPTATSGPIRVHVSGAVAHADVYTLPGDAIVRDALEAAGGPTDEADLSHLNLARSLNDNDQLYVPSIGEAPLSPDEGEGGSVIVTGLININTATQAELETLPDIGQVRARDIIAYREEHGPFASIEDIQNVPDIGSGIFEKIKDRITVGE